MTDSVAVIETERSYTNEVFCCCARFSDSDVAWFALIIKHYMYTYSPFYFALLRYSPCWLWLLSVADITCSVLLFFGILRCVGYGMSVCDAVLRECIAMLSKISSTP